MPRLDVVGDAVTLTGAGGGVEGLGLDVVGLPSQGTPRSYPAPYPSPLTQSGAMDAPDVWAT